MADLTSVGREILSASRNQLYVALPYLDAALFSLLPEPGGGVTNSLAADGQAQIGRAHV